MVEPEWVAVVSDQIPVTLQTAAPVTLNMLNHADALGFDLDGDQYAAIYRAMAALAPVPLVSDGELAAVRERVALVGMLVLCGEEECRDAAGLPQKLRALIDGLITVRQERDGALKRNEAMLISFAVMSDQLAARDARIAELDTLLARSPATDVPKPASNPFREFRGDPKRIGK